MNALCSTGCSQSSHRQSSPGCSQSCRTPEGLSAGSSSGATYSGSSSKRASLSFLKMISQLSMKEAMTLRFSGEYFELSSGMSRSEKRKLPLPLFSRKSAAPVEDEIDRLDSPALVEDEAVAEQVFLIKHRARVVQVAQQGRAGSRAHLLFFANGVEFLEGDVRHR